MASGPCPGHDRVTVAFRLRRLLAFLLLVGGAVPLAAMGLRDVTDAAMVPALVLGALLVITAFALMAVARWARLASLAWALAVGTAGVLALFGSLPKAAPFLLGYATLLGASLAGTPMYARFEGAATEPTPWRAPGMTLVRAALVTNLAGLMAGMVLLPPTFFHLGCFGGHMPLPETPWLMLGFLGIAALVSGGMVLLARQKTAGMLFLALAAPGMLLMWLLRGRFDAPVAAFFAPGLVCGWAVFLRYLPRMVRFVRA